VIRYCLPSYLDASFTQRHEHRVHFTVGPDYPFAPPAVRLLDTAIFHPNVFPDGRICIGAQWNPTEGLGFVVERVAKMLLYYDYVTNPGHPANAAAAHWYTANRARFPLCAGLAFPDPITGKMASRGKVIVVSQHSHRR
jgi:ubiquitin-protein ligase